MHSLSGVHRSTLGGSTGKYSGWNSSRDLFIVFIILRIVWKFTNIHVYVEKQVSITIQYKDKWTKVKLQDHTCFRHPLRKIKKYQIGLENLLFWSSVTVFPVVFSFLSARSDSWFAPRDGCKTWWDFSEDSDSSLRTPQPNKRNKFIKRTWKVIWSLTTSF